jgi:hypothetical protein
VNLFNFQINKEACFIYWAQYMAGWSWNKRQEEVDYYVNLIGGLNNKEKKALGDFLAILEKDGNGYFWLWKRYNGESLDNKEDRKRLKEVKRLLSDSFERVWNAEYPKLEKWKENLSSFNFDNSFEKFILKTESFFNKKNSWPLDVQLHFHTNERGTTGASKREFLNLILLGISNLDDSFLVKAVDTIFHEVIHLLDYQLESKDKLFKDLFMKSKLHGFDIGEISWKNLLKESVIYSIAGRNFSYFIRSVFPDMYMKMNDKKKLENFNYEKNKENYTFQAQSVACNIRDLTALYLDSEKEMDNEYISKIIKTWESYLGL